MDAVSMSFDHIGVVCRDMQDTRAFFSRSLGVSQWTDIFEDPIQKVRVQFGRDIGGLVFELISPSEKGSPVDTALKSGKNILNHVAYRVPDLVAAASQLQADGCVPVSQANPAVAFGGSMIQFFFSPAGFLIELIEREDEIHVFNRVV